MQQTVIDLLERDIEVHVIADACSSRSQMDRQFAYEVSYQKYVEKLRHSKKKKSIIILELEQYCLTIEKYVKKCRLKSKQCTKS